MSSKAENNGNKILFRHDYNAYFYLYLLKNVWSMIILVKTIFVAYPQEKDLRKTFPSFISLK